MKQAKWWYKVFDILVWGYILLWAFSLIAPNHWLDGIELAISIILRIAFISLIISALNAFEAFIKNERYYYYRVEFKYIPKGSDNRVISMNYGIKVKKPIWSNHEVLSKMQVHEEIYPKYKELLNNGAIEVTGITYLGSKFK